MIALPDGSFRFAVADGMEVAVAFDLRREDGRHIPLAPGIDFFSTSWLPPGRSLLFSVPRKALTKGRVVEVAYAYEWESGQRFSFNVEPLHHVEFWAYRLPERQQ